MKTLYRALFISDTHIPVNNKPVTGKDGSLFKFIKKNRKKFKKIFHIGDVTCMDDFAFHEKRKGQAPDLMMTLEQVDEFYTQLREASGKDMEITQVEGNHELRLERYLVRKAPELLPLECLTIPSLFKLKKHNIKWKGYSERLFVDGLKVTHGSLCRPESGNSARGELKAQKYKNPGVTGHTHRLGWVPDCDKSWMEIGHLADPDYSISAAYMGDREPNWQSGFGHGTCCQDEAGKITWFLHPVEVKDNHFEIDGEVY